MLHRRFARSQLQRRLLPFADSFTAANNRWTGANFAIGSGVATISPTISDTELLTNPGLEAPYVAGLANGWSKNGVPTLTEENTIINGGVSSQKIVTSVNGQGVFQYKNASMTAGTWYQMSAWVYGTGGALEGVTFTRSGVATAVHVTQANTWQQKIGAMRFISGSSGIYFRSYVTIRTLYGDDASIKALTTATLFAAVATSSSNVDAQVAVTVSGETQAGLVVNLDSTSNPQNFIIAYLEGTTTLKLDECVEGAYTNKASATITYVAGATLRVVKSGTSCFVYYGGALAITETTVTANANKNHGLFSTYSGNTFDDFLIKKSSASDDSENAVTTDYYSVYLGADGVLKFKTLAGAIMLDGPNCYIDHGTLSSNRLTSLTQTTNGDDITLTGTDTRYNLTVTHRFDLNLHSPFVTYTATLAYTGAATVEEERFDFTIPTQTGSVMKRDLRLTAIAAASTYYSDKFTAKVARFNNGVQFMGNDTMQSMRLAPSASNSRLSFWGDYSANHPYHRYIKNGGGEYDDLSANPRGSGDSYSVSLRFALDAVTTYSVQAPMRQPNGQEATLVFTSHADQETTAQLRAIAYGSEDVEDPTYGTKGLAGRGIGWTKSTFVYGDEENIGLDTADFKTLTDDIYTDGAEILGHSISPATDSRTTVTNGLAVLANYGAKNWIDHGAVDGSNNWEDIAGQGAVVADENYILDLLAAQNYKYAWSHLDLSFVGTGNINCLIPSTTLSYNPAYFYQNLNVPGLYLWSTTKTFYKPDEYFIPANIDALITQRGVNITHEYPAYSICENHTFYNNAGTIEIFPAFDDDLAYIQTQVAAGTLWSPTMAQFGDYLRQLEQILITNNADGTLTVKNNGDAEITGLTLLAEDESKTTVTVAAGASTTI